MSEDYTEMEDHDPLDDGPKPHCLGHRFHWAEFVFFLGMAGGIFFAIDMSSDITGLKENETFPLVLCVIYAAVAALGTALVWNLVSLKRVAACADMMKKEVEVLRAENQRARNMQEEKRKQDSQMKDQLANLEKAELLLKGSVTGLEDVQKQNEEMMADRLEMLEQRKELAGKLEEDMKVLFRATIEQAREELTDRAELYFKHADRDNDGIEVGGTEWAELEDLMTQNGIVLNTAAAGDDGIMDAVEFSHWLDTTLKYHFDELSVAVAENEAMKEEIRVLKIELKIRD